MIVASTLTPQDNQVSLDILGCQSFSCLNTQLEIVNKRLGGKDNSISAFHNELDALKVENDELRMRIQRLENLVFANNLDGSSPKNIKSDLKDSYLAIESNFEPIISRLEKRIQHLEKRVTTSNWFVASKQSGNLLPAGDIINYDGIVIDSLKRFDPKSGIFSAPRDGNYLFVVDGFKSGGVEGEIWIFVNEDVVKACSESDDYWWSSINGMVTVQLKANDQVKVHSYYNNSTYVDIYNPVTFIGFQLD